MEPQYYFLKSKWTDNTGMDYVMDAKDGQTNAALIAYRRKAEEEGTDNQVWELVVSEAPPYLYISSKLTGLVIDVPSLDPKPDTPLLLYPQKGDGTDNQLWRLVPSDERQYFFVTSKLNNLVITFPGTKPEQKTQLTVAPRHPEKNDQQLWTLVPDR